MTVRRWFAPALLPLVVAVAACAPPSDPDSENSNAAFSERPAATAALAPTSIKIVEADAMNEGATGVHSWVTYLTATPGSGGAPDEIGLLAYGVDQDGIGRTVLYYDLRRGALAAYENGSTRAACASTDDGSDCDAVAATSMPLYRAELAHIFQAIPAGRTSSTQTHALTLDRGDACWSAATNGIFVLSTALAAGTLALLTGPLTVGVTAVAVASAAGAAVGVTALVGMSTVMNGAAKSLPIAVIEGAKSAGKDMADNVSTCLRAR